MTKLLLPKNNTIWGVIAKPQSSNVYRQILSFATPELKDKFINDKLFNGEDYKELLKAQPNIAYTQQSPVVSIWTIDPADYPDESDATLFDKDFAIIEENGVLKFFAITDAQRNGQMIDFTGELDIFFTHDIKDMFNDNQARIGRAMLDRYRINNDILEVVYKNQKVHDTLIYNTEPIDANIKENLQVAKKYEIKVADKYWDDIIDPNLSDAQKIEINKQMNELQLQVLASVVDDNRESKILKPYDPHIWNHDTFNVVDSYGHRVVQPYSLNLANNSFIDMCIYNASGDKAWNPFNTDYFADNAQRTEHNFINAFDTKELGDASIVKTSYTLAPLNIFEMLINWLRIYTKDDPAKITDHIGLSMKDGRVWLNINVGKENTSSVFKSDSCPVGFKESAKSIQRTSAPFRMVLHYLDKSLLNDSKLVENIFNDVNIADLDIANKHDNHKYEVKSLIAPYRKYEMKSTSKFSLDILPQYFTTNEISGVYSFGFLTEQWTQWFRFNNYYNNIYRSAQDLPMELDYSYEDANNYSFATDINAWSDFITSNKAQQNASFLNKGIGLVTGSLGAIATGGFASLGLASVAMKSAGDLNSQFAQRKDIKNTPNKLVNAGSILLQDLVNKTLKPALYLWELNGMDKTLVNEFFHKFGYNFNSKLSNFNEYIDSRYYFNYLEVLECFENIKLQASSEIKQIINDTLASGVTIWHVRDLDTFKGIKNYEYENVEMSIVNAKANRKKKK